MFESKVFYYREDLTNFLNKNIDGDFEIINITWNSNYNYWVLFYFIEVKNCS